MLTLRPFDYSDDDYRRMIDINVAVFNEPAEPQELWKHEDRVRDPSYPYLRDTVLRDGMPVAYVETFQNQFAYHPQKYTCYIFVDPAHDDADIRPWVLARVQERLADQGLTALMSGMLEDKIEAMRFFADFGFERVAAEILSKLDVTHFDASRYAALLARVRAEGIEIVPVRALMDDDPDWQRRLYDLDVTVNRDIPSVGEKHYPELAGWIEMRLNGPGFDPDAWFVALDGPLYVGQSQGLINREGSVVQIDTGVTAIRRTYRRRGLATALKVHVIRFAQAQGVQEIITANDSNNPMYALNLALGFEPVSSWVRVEKKL